MSENENAQDRHDRLMKLSKKFSKLILSECKTINEAEFVARETERQLKYLPIKLNDSEKNTVKRFKEGQVYLDQI
ncbi:hypothetical protein [Jeotgalibacillus terrae]|uniref:Uncharacterized protein n=1 Tax=Jeotgalibacillus terrae TaxID=587735 RepID=A0ABW5ZHD8_9BACL|nr:hypothetical protein [Jeotgalibacillus terrae]MBM7580060.1 hypothetical protein [Jeotgalibacillus terrae]